jgi:hypothetical protein
MVQQMKPGEPAHFKVSQYDIRRKFLDKLEPFFGGRSGMDFVAFVIKDRLKDIPLSRLIVDDYNY